MKDLIKCGNCEVNGTTSILGSITPEGFIDIERHRKGYTEVKFTAGTVTCGNCNHDSYVKSEVTI